MTRDEACFRLYSCIVAESEEEFCKAYCHNRRGRMPQNLYEYVSGRKKRMMYKKEHQKDKKND